MIYNDRYKGIIKKENEFFSLHLQDFKLTVNNPNLS